MSNKSCTQSLKMCVFEGARGKVLWVVTRRFTTSNLPQFLVTEDFWAERKYLTKLSVLFHVHYTGTIEK